jgi:hypothetical protein
MTTLDHYQKTRVATLRAVMQQLRSAPHLQSALTLFARTTGMSVPRLKTVYYDWQKRGDEALVNKRKMKRAVAATRASLWALSEREQQALRQYALKTDSVPMAIEAFADSEKCSDQLRAVIAGYRATRNYPRPLCRAARVTPEERAINRGDRRFQLASHVQFRANRWVDAAGIEHPLVGGDLFEMDDMSLNQPFWYEWPYGGDPLSDRFGVRLGRQMLAAVDTATAFPVGFDLVGRVRDAYRAEDVVRFIDRICRTHGVPRLGLRLERGVWAARTVRGVAGANDEEERELISSVRDVVPIEYVYSPNTKGVIEGWFNLLQRVLALSGIQIGRTRGEFERTTQLMLQVNNGRRHPADCGFPHLMETAATVQKAFERLADRVKKGRILRGVPREKFVQALQDRPLAPIAEERAHVLQPVKQVRPVDRGFVRVRVPHYRSTFSFEVPAEFAHLGTGYKVLVCFDPAEPDLGARILDAESDRRRDYDAQAGMFYGTWAYVPDAPQIDYSDAPASNHKREYLAAARTAFRATGMVPGTGASVDQVHNGTGRVRRVERHLESNTGASPADEITRIAQAAQDGRRAHVRGPQPTARATALQQAFRSDAAALLNDDETPSERATAPAGGGFDAEDLM